MTEQPEQEEKIETCQCTSRKAGFTALPQEDGSVLWVCGDCKLPTQGLVEGMRKQREQWG